MPIKMPELRAVSTRAAGSSDPVVSLATAANRSTGTGSRAAVT